LSSYAVYKGNKYKLDVGEKISLTSDSIESLKYGFEERKFSQGFISKVYYKKQVNKEDLEDAYELEYKVIYKGKEFIPWAVGKFSLQDGDIALGTNDYEIASAYDFKKMEQFVFKKDVPLEEIELLIEIKKHILQFKDLKDEITEIKNEDIKSYLSSLL
jgi:hypothetical protein